MILAVLWLIISHTSNSFAQENDQLTTVYGVFNDGNVGDCSVINPSVVWTREHRLANNGSEFAFGALVGPHRFNNNEKCAWAVRCNTAPSAPTTTIAGGCVGKLTENNGAALPIWASQPLVETVNGVLTVTGWICAWWNVDNSGSHSSSLSVWINCAYGTA